MQKHRKLPILSLVLILFLTLAIFPAVQGQVFGQQDNHEHKAATIQVVDCVEEFDETKPHRLVLQIINNTFHKWREYDVGYNGELRVSMYSSVFSRASFRGLKSVGYRISAGTQVASMTSLPLFFGSSPE